VFAFEPGSGELQSEPDPSLFDLYFAVSLDGLSMASYFISPSPTPLAVSTYTVFLSDSTRVRQGQKQLNRESASISNSFFRLDFSPSGHPSILRSALSNTTQPFSLSVLFFLFFFSY
jgi:hypothetical protein